MTSPRSLRLVALAVLLLLAGCYRHNFPLETGFRPPAYIPPKYRVFVDMNGSFYPDGWRCYIDPAKRWRNHSLLQEAAANPSPAKCPAADVSGPAAPSLREALVAAEKRQLDDIAAYLKGKSRVFILIHGFNNSEAEASEAYDIMERTIAFKPDDALIEFYWDGYVQGRGLGQLSPVGFWFSAVSNSQRAGQFGLRPILARLNGQQAILISHSRGASVILSALSNPPFAQRFVGKTRSIPALADRPLDPPALVTKARAIDALMLAPAIGRLDFCQQMLDAPADQRCPRLRDFPLRLLAYTVNPADPVLDKFIGLSRLANPTDLGLKPGAGEAIRQEAGDRYAFMTAVPVARTHAHGFPCYASDPEFATMLGLAGVAANPPGTLPATWQRAACKTAREGR